MIDLRRRPSSRPSEGQKAAREEELAACKNKLARKKRTCELIQFGGVYAHYSFKSPGQMDELLAALSTRDSWVEWLQRQGVDLGPTE